MIDLGEKIETLNPVPCGCCEDDDKAHYPSIYINKDEEIKLPDSGQMVVKFEVVSREMSERDGKKSYSCQVKLKKISQVKGPKPQKLDRFTESSQILDALRDEATRDLELGESDDY
jgi:hypothetical protein